ncbi:MAG: hypothetical protein Kow0098_07350 [Ignavibacteriaceae bacterium]
MNITENIKSRIARIYVKNLIKEKSLHKTDFSRFYSNSYSFFVLMPEDEKDFNFAKQVLEFLVSDKKNITVFTHDYRVSLLSPSFRTKVIDFGISDLTRLDLPSKQLINKLKSQRFNVVLDLNREENLFCSYIVGIVDAAIKAGFLKSGSERYFNFQFSDSESKPEISYKNLLNCLQMF